MVHVVNLKTQIIITLERERRQRLLFILTWANRVESRPSVPVGPNKDEACNALATAVFFYRLRRRSVRDSGNVIAHECGSQMGPVADGGLSTSQNSFHNRPNVDSLGMPS